MALNRELSTQPLEDLIGSVKPIKVELHLGENQKDEVPEVDGMILQYRKLLLDGEKKKADRVLAKVYNEMKLYMNREIQKHMLKMYGTHEKIRKRLSIAINEDDGWSEAHYVFMTALANWQADIEGGLSFANYVIVGLKKFLTRLEYKLGFNRAGTARKHGLVFDSADREIYTDDLKSYETVISNVSDCALTPVGREEEKEKAKLYKELLDVVFTECNINESLFFILSHALGPEAIDRWKRKYKTEIFQYADPEFRSLPNKIQREKKSQRLKEIFWDKVDSVKKQMTGYEREERIEIKRRMDQKGKEGGRDRKTARSFHSFNKPVGEEEILLNLYLSVYRQYEMPRSFIGDLFGVSRERANKIFQEAEEKVRDGVKKRKLDLKVMEKLGLEKNNK